MNLGMHVGFWNIVFYGYMLRSGIVGSYDISIFNFSRNLCTVHHSGYIPTSGVGGFLSLHTFYSICYFSVSSSSVQSLSHVQLLAAPRTAARQTSLSITNTQSLLKLISIELVMPSDQHMLCHPFLLSTLILYQLQGLFQWLALCIRWPMYWNFSISPSNEDSGLIPFRIDWFDLLAVQGTFKNLLQYHSSKASILRCSAFFIVQLSHPYMTTGKTIALTGQTFAGKVMSLFFNMWSRLVIAFLSRSKCLLISWLQSPSALTLQSKKKIKSLSVSIVSPSICHEVMGPDAMILVFWMLNFKPAFHSPLSLSSRGSLVLLRFLP